MEKKEYVPLACSLYDQLEALATQKKTCTITFRRDETVVQRTGVIEDLFSKEGAEFMKVSTGDIIRLDALNDIDGIPMNTTC